MRKFVMFVAFATMLINSPLKGQGHKRITLVIPKEQPIETNVLETLKHEIGKSKLVDSIELKGMSYPVIVINPYPDYLLRYNLDNQKILRVLKQNLEIPVWEDINEHGFYCKLEDYKVLNGNTQIDRIGLISLESVDFKGYVYLMQVANIYFKLKTDSVFYKGKEVYSISFNYKGQNESGFKQLLNLLDLHEIKYEVVNELLSVVSD